MGGGSCGRILRGAIVARSDCTVIAVFVSGFDTSLQFISVNFLDDEGSRLEHFEMGTNGVWDIDAMATIIRRVIAQQMVLWKPPLMK
jgi:hypothetical protein